MNACTTSDDMLDIVALGEPMIEFNQQDAARPLDYRLGFGGDTSNFAVSAARHAAIPLLPGVMTPSDVIAAKAAGYRELKLFPAQQAGGIGMLRALGGPFPDVTFCPTGGVTPANAPDFLALTNVACVGGSWLTPKEAMAAGDWDRVSALAREAAALRPR